MVTKSRVIHMLTIIGLKWLPYLISTSGRAALRAAADAMQRIPACPEIPSGNWSGSCLNRGFRRVRQVVFPSPADSRENLMASTKPSRKEMLTAVAALH
jgi:hypothetical protein